MMRYFVTIRDEVMQVDVDGDRILLEGAPVEARIVSGASAGVRSLRLGHRSHSLVSGDRTGDVRIIHLDGERFRVEVVDERTRRIREMAGAGGGVAGPRPLKAPMPGLVVKVEVSEGEAVTRGQGLVIVEAMKMENELKAEADGVVSRILVRPGQAVEKDQVLLDFATSAPEDGGEEGEG